MEPKATKSLTTMLTPRPKPITDKTIHLDYIYMTTIGCRLVFREKLPLESAEVPGAKRRRNVLGTAINILWDWDSEECVKLIRGLLAEKGYKLDVENCRTMYSKSYHSDSYSRQSGQINRAGNSPVFQPYTMTRDVLRLERA